MCARSYPTLVVPLKNHPQLIWFGVFEMEAERIENVGIIELDDLGGFDGNERFVRSFFERKGYQVLKLRSRDTSMEAENLEELLPFTKDAERQERDAGLLSI